MIDSKVIADAARVYVVSNTPRYLFKKLRSLQTIQAMGEHKSVEALRKEGERLAKLAKPTMDDELTFYVILGAMSFKPLSTTRQALQTLADASFRWARPFADIIVAEYQPTNEVAWQLGPQFSQAQPRQRGADTSIHLQVGEDR